MKLALRLSERGLGYTESNPLVGAVVVKDGQILSTGYHGRFGDKHAEQMAVQGIDCSGATLYVTLEPCAHQGKTPPCADLVVRKGIKRVVIGLEDSHPLVSGRGLDCLSRAGITVESGLMRDEIAWMNRFYLKLVEKKTPYVVLRAGVSIDGKLSDFSLQSRWVTDISLRKISRSYRGEFSAIMAGSETVLRDDPQLTLRNRAWSGKRMYRVILDSRNRIPAGSRIFREQKRFPLILFSSNEAPDQTARCRNHFFLEPDTVGLNLTQVLLKLGEMCIASLLVEGGGRLIESFLAKRLYDELILFTAPSILGGKTSVELLAGGAGIKSPVRFKDVRIIELERGHILRGLR